MKVEGHDYLTYDEMMVKIGSMSGLYVASESNSKVAAAIASAGVMDSMASVWLPVVGPDASDEEREGVKEKLLVQLVQLDTTLSSSAFVASEDMSFADIVTLPPVLSLFKYVLGEDVRNSLGNIQKWIDRMCAMDAVASATGMLHCSLVTLHCIFSQLDGSIILLA